MIKNGFMYCDQCGKRLVSRGRARNRGYKHNFCDIKCYGKFMRGKSK